VDFAPARDGKGEYKPSVKADEVFGYCEIGG
jgi:hypothetical protein